MKRLHIKLSCIGILLTMAVGILPQYTDPIDLIYFTAYCNSGQITIEWETASEIDNAGFLVLRSTSPDLSFMYISGFIPAQGSAVIGAHYEFMDTNFVDGIIYHYMLEVIDTSNNSTFYGPVSIEANCSIAEATIFLPLVSMDTRNPVATLHIWVDGALVPILSELADDFFEAYRVEVIVEEVSDIYEQFPIAAPAGEGPDITIFPHDRMGKLVTSDLLAPVDLGLKTNMFIPSSLEAITNNGVLYGMPYVTENLGFFYNTDLVPIPPTTWDEVLTIGKALQAEGKVTYGMGLSGNTYDTYPLMTAHGGYIFGKDGSGNYNPEDLGIDNPGMIAAGQWLEEAAVDGFISDSTDWDTAHVFFETGEVPFLMAGPWALDRIRESRIPYAISNFPTQSVEGFPFSGVLAFVINAYSENPLLAQAFLTEFVATEDVMADLYVAKNRPSAFQPVLYSTEDPDLQALGIAGLNATAIPAIQEMSYVWGPWNDAIAMILLGEQTPEEALRNAASQIRELIDGEFEGMVNVPGSWQVAAGVCTGDWDPACEGSALTETEDGKFSGTFVVLAGNYEAKIALNGGWDINYGVGGVPDGDNYEFSLVVEGSVTFIYDPETHLLDIVLPETSLSRNGVPCHFDSSEIDPQQDGALTATSVVWFCDE